MPCFLFIVVFSSLPLNCSSLTLSQRIGRIGIHRASEGLHDQITKTGNARNQSRKKFFVSFYKADFLAERSVVRGQGRLLNINVGLSVKFIVVFFHAKCIPTVNRKNKL